MRVAIFGSTGRVGAAAVRAALAARHEVRAAVRRQPAIRAEGDRLSYVVADILEPATIARAVTGMDAAIVAVGGDVFKPSDVVTRSAREIVEALGACGIARYIGITGVAQMRATFPGRLAQAVLRRSPIRYAVADHQRAFEIVRASDLDWTLAACPWIKDGADARAYREHPDIFPGGFHTIAPAGVGAFLVAQLGSTTYRRRVVGLW
jgi:putative NADH-flavin reductase